MNIIGAGEVTGRDSYRQREGGGGLRKKQIEIQWREKEALCLFRVCLCHCVARAEGLHGCLSDTGGCRALLMALQLSICHQSSANEGTVSAGVHVISTICDSTHEALVHANTLVSLFWEGTGKQARKGRYMCTYVCTLFPSRVTGTQLDSNDEGGGGGRQIPMNLQKGTSIMCPWGCESKVDAWWVLHA